MMISYRECNNELTHEIVLLRRGQLQLLRNDLVIHVQPVVHRVVPEIGHMNCHSLVEVAIDHVGEDLVLDAWSPGHSLVVRRLLSGDGCLCDLGDVVKVLCMG